MSAPDHLMGRKKALRARLRAERDAVPPAERTRKSEEIARRLFGLPGILRVRTVMVFSSFGSEVETRPIIERLAAGGVLVALPRVEGRRIVAVAYSPGDPISPAPFGAMEPTGSRVIGPREIDVVVTPGLAFDRRGYRVGYGGGFYDVFLRRMRRDALRVGVCFALQVVDEVPNGPMDRPVHVIVTDEDVVRCR
ncbi:MAG: 5-formyltetrahydrofolate cyclo-ligase [Actinomycetota bacterium]